MEKVTIERLDNFGRGIGYINGKIIFIPDTLPGEEVTCKIINDKKNYLEAELISIEKFSDKRIKPKCKYYDKCGGCNLGHLLYEETISFKKNKIQDLLKRNNLYDKDIEIIKNNYDFNYRNKIELKVKDGLIGFYQNKTHDIVGIDKCLITKDAINNAIKDIKLNNGDITIRCNYNDELLLIVNTDDNFNYEDIIKNNKVVGIILNDKLIYGENYFTQVINNLYFKVSYDAFFQINEYICSKLFEIINDNIDNEVVCDLYCGVATLGIAAKRAKKVYGIEIIENAIIDAITNAKINKKDNMYFMCGDASLVSKIDDNIDTFIVDPPRSGLSKEVVDTILNSDAKKIIYVSCDPQTLIRDLKILKEKYDIKDVKALDMFSYTYHVETVCILKK